MAQDLTDRLTDIHGIGEAKAAEIIELLEEHDAATSDDVEDAVRTAYDYYEDGQAHQAEQFLRQAYEAL